MIMTRLKNNLKSPYGKGHGVSDQRPRICLIVISI